MGLGHNQCAGCEVGNINWAGYVFLVSLLPRPLIEPSPCQKWKYLVLKSAGTSLCGGSLSQFPQQGSCCLSESDELTARSGDGERTRFRCRRQAGSAEVLATGP